MMAQGAWRPAWDDSMLPASAGRPAFRSWSCRSAMNKWLQPALASLVLAVALALRWYDPPILGDLRALVFDQYQRVAPREYKPAPVKIVDIDDESLKRYGQWPWPRGLIAELLGKL